MSTCRLIKLGLATTMLASTSVVSNAADVPRVPAYRGIPLVYNWTGFYGGVHLGPGGFDGGSAGLVGGSFCAIAAKPKTDPF